MHELSPASDRQQTLDAVHRLPGLSYVKDDVAHLRHVGDVSETVPQCLGAVIKHHFLFRLCGGLLLSAVVLVVVLRLTL